MKAEKILKYAMEIKSCMSEEERDVVLSYNGSEEAYQNVYENRNDYIIDRKEMLKLEQGE